ncbi:MAG: hypothetical protein JSV36_17285 [Anaerolineae bacterium]|nr:MAG: hypothetical protein JSV36_17285 [Anaerolineae bacterium]
MFKRLMMLLFTVLLLSGLMACQSPTPEATPAPPTPLPTLVPTATPVVATSTPLPTDTTSPDLQATPSPTAESGETRLSPTPTVAWQIPEVQSDDWVKGGDGAGLVIVEYGDFQ